MSALRQKRTLPSNDLSGLFVQSGTLLELQLHAQLEGDGLAQGLGATVGQCRDYQAHRVGRIKITAIGCVAVVEDIVHQTK